MRTEQLLKPLFCAISAAVNPNLFFNLAGEKASRRAVQITSWPPCAAYMSAVLPSLFVSEVSAFNARRPSTRRWFPRWAAKSSAVLPWPFWKLTFAPCLWALSTSLIWTPSWSFHLPLARSNKAVSPFSSVMLRSPPFSMEDSAVLTSFWLMALMSKAPYFFGRSFSASMSRSSCVFLALSCGTGSPDIFSRQFLRGLSGSRGSTLTMSPADRPRESSSVASAPASRRIFVMSVLPCFAAIINAVCPIESFVLRSAFASITICNNSLEPFATQ
mmetsp:Transcript_25730/g.81204  ORF Transcript_25730/g.81204 Transcript_25730/m.81204 type:complete len:273 (-) Transcript_25730:1036-1854(-)